MKTIAVVQAALLALSTAGAADAADTAAAGNGAAGASLADASYCYHHIAGHGCGGVPGWSGAFPPLQGSGLLPAGADAPWWSDAGRHGGPDAGAPADLNAVPVPEPDNYSMLLIGLVLLAFTSRGHATEKFAP